MTGCATATFPDAGARGSSTTYVVDSSGYHFSKPAIDYVRNVDGVAAPIAWGRYVVNRAGGSAESSGAREVTASEVASFRSARMRMIPIVAPNQKELAGSFDDGKTLASEAVSILSGVITGFGNPQVFQEVLVYLDVEGDTHPIAREFLEGWCAGIRAAKVGNVSFQPALYTNGGLGGKEVRQVIASNMEGCQLKGLWLANYLKKRDRPERWKNFAESKENNLPRIPDAIPIYLWQYFPSGKLDWNMVNPDLEANLKSLSLALW